MYPILIKQTRTKQPMLIFEFVMIIYTHTHMPNLETNEKETLKDVSILKTILSKPISKELLKKKDLGTHRKMGVPSIG